MVQQKEETCKIFICVWGSQAVIHMFQLGSAEHIDQVSLDLYMCPQKGQQRRKEPFLLCLNLIVSDAVTVM